MIKIVVCDDHTLIRKGVSSLITSISDNFEVIADVENGAKLLDYLSLNRTVPDIILLDINMPVMDGYTVAAKLTTASHPARILAFSMHNSQEAIQKIIACGARGFITKNSEMEELKTALHNMYYDGYHINQYIHEPMIAANTLKQPIAEINQFKLSKKEYALLPTLCTNKSYKEIASLYNVSFKTIDNHRQRIFKKMNVNSRTGLSAKAMQLGLLVTSVK